MNYQMLFGVLFSIAANVYGGSSVEEEINTDSELEFNSKVAIISKGEIPSDKYAFSELVGKRWVLIVEESATNLNGQAILDDSDFSPLESSYSIHLLFSLNSVEFMNTEISGQLSNETDSSQDYFLDEGLFAGGHLVIHLLDRNSTGFEAIYTISGSGLPIIFAVKGTLIQYE